MCIAILNQKSTLKDSVLENSWNNNNEGAGLLWTESGYLQTFKTYKLKDLKRKYKEIRNNPNVQTIVLHFRIATSGHEKYTNLHPFLVNERLGFVHNGIISGLGNNVHSDTYQFNELLKGLPKNFLDCQSTMELISSYVNGSKLVFLDSNNTHTIVNENLGRWDGDTWYSNDSYQCSLNYKYYGNEIVYNHDNYYSLSYEQENTEYLETFWTNYNLFDVETCCDVLGTNIGDRDLWTIFEEAAYNYGTNDLRKLASLLFINSPLKTYKHGKAN